MIPAQWDAADFDDDQPSSGRAAPTLVNLHFVRSAMRRRWLVCVLSAVMGLLIAAGLLAAFPALHDANAVLVLAHQPEDEPSQAMATDVSLLETRTLAEKAVTSLGLTMTPDDFLKTVTADPVSSELLSITLTAPNDAEAVRRLGVLTSLYLDFRGQQLSLQSKVYVQGVQQRIAKLQSEVGTLSQKVEQLSDAGSGSAGKLSDTISQRAFIQGRIDTLQQEIEDVTLQTTSVVSSSRVIDPAAVEPHAAKRRIALALVSGFIGGAALGCGMVLFFAITSDRLRRRSDVAAALEVPVRASVRRITPISKRWLRIPHLRTLDRRRSGERQRLAHAIQMELPTPRRSGRIAVACIDNSDEVSFAVAAAAADLTEEGFSTTLIDLTERGSLAEIGPSAPGSHNVATVLRPRGVPTLANGPVDLRTVGEDENLPSPVLADIILVLADLDPSVGADHLAAWTDRVIIVVTAGRSSAEILRTAADLARTAGLELRFAALLRTERTDDSSGTAAFNRLAPIHLVDAHQPQYAAGSVDEERDIVKALTIPDQQLWAEVGDEQFAVEDHVADQAQSGGDEQIVDEDEAPTLQELADHEQFADEQFADQEQTADEGQTPTVLQQIVEERASEEEQIVDEDQITYQQQIADEEALAPEQQIAEDQAPDEEQVAVDEEQIPYQPIHEEEEEEEEAPTLLQQKIIDEEEALAPEQQIAEEQAPDEEQIVDEEQITYQQQIADEEAPTLLQQKIIDEEEALAPEQQIAAEEQITYQQQIADQDSEQESAVTDTDAETALMPELDQPVGVPQENNVGDGWHLYIDRYLPASTRAEPSADDEEFDWNWDWEPDNLDAKPNSAVNGADHVSRNGEQHRSAPDIRTEGDVQDEAHRPTGDGKAANGQGRQRTRAKTQSRRRRGGSK